MTRRFSPRRQAGPRWLVPLLLLLLLLLAVVMFSRPAEPVPAAASTATAAPELTRLPGSFQAGEFTPPASPTSASFAAGVVAAQTTAEPGGPTATATRRPTRTPRPTATPDDGLPTIAFDKLPRQAQETIRLIDQGGPFPYRQDGTVFQNRERLLPAKPSGYYREYTVVTPGESDRGARRIIAGAGGELYYTADHYASFKRVVR